MKEKKKNLYWYLSEIEDYRRAEGKKHTLPIVLLIALMAVMSWFTGERAMWDFVKRNEKDLRKYLKPKKWYLPSYQTIDAVLTRIWYEKVEEKFKEWMKEEIKIEEYDQICLDWKAMRWTLKEANWKRQDFINTVSAFHNRKKQVVLSKSIRNKKESEIPKVKEIIEELWLKWVIFTADALHCQKKTLETIVDTGNHYIIWVKWNQKKLKQKIEKQDKNKSYEKHKMREKK